jgi:hypothetical protein
MPPNPDRIEICSWSACGIYGGPTCKAEYSLERSGPCRLKVTHGTNVPTIRQVTEYELPPEAFDECRQLLQSTRFFWMRSARPDFEFEASGQGIQVKYGRWEHMVDVVSPARAPEGFDRIMKFLGELEQRGKPLAAPKEEAEPGAADR